MAARRELDATRSADLSRRLQASLPGGDTRSVTYYPPFPIAMARGKGYRLWDVDGNEYIDLLNNYTSLIHGHAHPVIVKAIHDQAERGSVFPAPTELQGDLAERICARMPLERVRFTNSGSEAVMMAVRAARAITGREKIVKVDGGYHGSWEQVPMSHSRAHGSVGISDRAEAVEDWDRGVPDCVRNLLAMIDFNDCDDLERVMHAYGSDIAAIILEPVLGEGIVAATSAFASRARDLADEHGALLIFDEVVTARLDPGGYQSVLGVQPDLTTLGKIIGGGLPVGAIGGKAAVMEVFDPRRAMHVTHSGTFNGNSLTMAAGVASVDLLTKAEIARLNRLGEELADRLNERIADIGLDAYVQSCGSLLLILFGRGTPARAFRDVDLEHPLLLRFHRAALERRIYLAPRGLMCLTTPMDGRVVDQVADALEDALISISESPERLAI